MTSKTTNRNSDALAMLQERVQEMGLDEATARLKSLLQRETFSYVEAGAILQRCHDEWYEDKAQYEAFVHNELRIDLDKARRLRRVSTSIQAAQLTMEDVRGITVSAIQVLQPILESPKQKEHVPAFLEQARTLSITALRDAVRKHLGKKPSDPKGPAEHFEASVGGFVNAVQGDSLDVAEETLGIVAQQFPSLWFRFEVTDTETGEVRQFFLNEPEEPMRDYVEGLHSRELGAAAEMTA